MLNSKRCKSTHTVNYIGTQLIDREWGTAVPSQMANEPPKEFPNAAMEEEVPTMVPRQLPLLAIAKKQVITVSPPPRTPHIKIKALYQQSNVLDEYLFWKISMAGQSCLDIGQREQWARTSLQEYCERNGAKEGSPSQPYPIHFLRHHKHGNDLDWKGKKKEKDTNHIKEHQIISNPPLVDPIGAAFAFGLQFSERRWELGSCCHHCRSLG